MGFDSPFGGTGPRLISVTEAAVILAVEENVVREWIAEHRIPHSILPDGQPGVRLIDESQFDSGPVQGGLVTLELGGGDRQARQDFYAELARRRQESTLLGLDFGEVDVEALVIVLAEHLQRAVLDGIYLTAEHGTVWTKNASGFGSGSNTALSVSGEDVALEERIRRAAEDLLEKAQDMIAEETTEPWPAASGQLPDGVPTPCAEITGQQIRWFYGDPDAPILELAPIPVADVRSAGS